MIKLEAMGAITWLYKKLFIEQYDRPRADDFVVHGQLNA